MTDEPDNIVLQYLRRIDTRFERVDDDLHGVKVRLIAVVEGMAGVHRRMDRSEARLEKIERRLDLVNSSH